MTSNERIEQLLSDVLAELKRTRTQVVTVDGPPIYCSELWCRQNHSGQCGAPRVAVTEEDGRLVMWCSGDQQRREETKARV